VVAFSVGQRDRFVGKDQRTNLTNKTTDSFMWQAIVGLVCEIVGLKSYASWYGDYSGKVASSRGLDGGYS